MIHKVDTGILEVVAGFTYCSPLGPADDGSIWVLALSLVVTIAVLAFPLKGWRMKGVSIPRIIFSVLSLVVAVLFYLLARSDRNSFIAQCRGEVSNAVPTLAQLNDSVVSSVVMAVAIALIVKLVITGIDAITSRYTTHR